MTRRFVLERRPVGHLGAPLLFAAMVPIVVAAGAFILGANLKAPVRLALVIGSLLGTAAAIFRAVVYLERLPFHEYLILGDDGIRIYGKENPSRFISHATIVSVRATDDGFVEIEHARGSPISSHAERRSGDAAADTYAREIADAISTNWRKFQADSRSLSELPTLANNARSARDQIAELRAIGAGQAENFRRAPLLRETLWRVAENPAGSATERIAASIALRVSAPEDDVKRLRLLADASADSQFSDKLRVAIDGNENAIQRVLVEEVAESNSLPERLRRARR